jgi:hypothetical protein
MNEWHPIETAPKDGTPVILFFPNNYWRTDLPVALGFGSEDGWYEGEADSHSMTAFGSQPTHWMPLPKPPTTSSHVTSETHCDGRGDPL